MNAPFDPVPGPGDQHRSVPAPAPGYPGELLGTGTRRFLALTAALSGIVALTHQPLTAALASVHGAGALGAAHALLTWPWPLTQPILAGVAAFVLIAIGIQARGWRQVTGRQRWYLWGFTVAAVLGAGPMVLLLTLIFAIVALAIGIGLVMFFGLLAILILRR